jgi:hypothetical protein
MHLSQEERLGPDILPAVNGTQDSIPLPLGWDFLLIGKRKSGSAHLQVKLLVS